MGKDLKGHKLPDNISQRTDGRYMARFTDRYGKRRCKYSDSLTELKIWLNEQKALDVLKQSRIDDTVTLDAWFDNKWITIFKSNISPNSKQQYVMVYDKHIREELGFKKLGNIQSSDIKNIINKTQQEGYGFETLRRIRIMFLDMFNRAIEDQVVGFNPCRSIKVERDERKQPFVLSPDDKIAFFTVAKGTYYYNAFKVHLLLGLRPGELFALTWNDIDFDNNEITINKSLVYQKYLDNEQKEFHIGPTKTKASIRKLAMTEQVKSLLLNQQTMQRNLYNKLCENRKEHLKQVIKTDYKEPLYNNIKFSDLVFTSTQGGALCAQTYNDAILRIINEVNVQRDSLEEMEVFTGHSFRHTFASDLYNLTKDIKLVSKLVGHARVETTANIYIHNSDGINYNGLKIISDALKEIELEYED